MLHTVDTIMAKILVFGIVALAAIGLFVLLV